MSDQTNRGAEAEAEQGQEAPGRVIVVGPDGMAISGGD